MALYKIEHRSSDGLIYVYFWVRMLSEEAARSGAGSGQVVMAQPQQIVDPGSVVSRKQQNLSFEPAQMVEPPVPIVYSVPPGIVIEVSHYVFPSSYDNSRNNVTIFQLPPGTKRDEAAKWIETKAGKDWAGKGIVFLAHTCVNPGGA